MTNEKLFDFDEFAKWSVIVGIYIIVANLLKLDINFAAGIGFVVLGVLVIFYKRLFRRSVVWDGK